VQRGRGCSIQAESKQLSAVELAVHAAVQDGCDRTGILAAAGPLIEHCRNHYGFTVMRDGLSAEPDELADALLTLMRGLSHLESEFGGRPFWSLVSTSATRS
jgi:hypothetical protein